MQPVSQQLRTLRGLGLIGPQDGDQLEEEGLVVLHPDHVGAGELVPHLRHAGKPGFVVADLTDLPEFVSIPQVTLPPAPLYLATGPERGDELANRSPDEALPALLAAGRSPMTIHEGLCWLIQQPEMLVRNHCFMVIGSRKPRTRGGLDARTPALWISNGTGRDTAVRRDAPKLGWCWAGNRHTWLGFGSVAARSGLGTGGPG